MKYQPGFYLVDARTTDHETIFVLQIDKDEEGLYDKWTTPEAVVGRCSHSYEDRSTGASFFKEVERGGGTITKISKLQFDMLWSIFDPAPLPDKGRCVRCMYD